MDFVYAVPAQEMEKLKKMLEKDPYGGESFARLGYYLKEAKAVGLEGSEYVLYFKADEAVGKKLLAGLCGDVEEKYRKATEGRSLSEEQKKQIRAGLESKQIDGLRELSAEDKRKVIAAIEESENNAAAGFGNIFG